MYRLMSYCALHAELYGPQDPEAISSAAEAAANCMELILDELAGEGTPEETTRERNAADTFTDAMQQLAQAVAALQLPEGDRASLSSEE